MLIKRLAAILLSIMLLMQLSACKDDDNYTLTSYFQTPASSQGASSESFVSESGSNSSLAQSGINSSQGAVSSQQNNSVCYQKYKYHACEFVLNSVRPPQ